MTRQVKTTPRKHPRQQRAKATVETILTAAARILKKRGFDGFTTNEVATTAGVSIGSLYQYFPNKQALVVALIDRHIDRIHAAVVGELARVSQLPVLEGVRAMVELTVGVHAVDLELHRILYEQVPRIGRMARVLEVDLIVQRVLASYLTARRDELSIANPDLAAFVLVSAIESVILRAAALYPRRLEDPALIDEMTRLVTRYLGAPNN